MPLTTGDIKIFKSDTMEDTNDGGGEITKNEVVFGVSNNVFDDISTLDRVGGAVHLRKIYGHAFIQTLDKYASAHTAITKLPKDTKIGINLFSTNDFHDRRPAAQSRIESYRAKGAKYVGFLWATQWQGSKVLTIFQSTAAPIPVIADVLYLTQNGDTQSQFVKITKVTEEVQSFTINDRNFKRRIVNLEISQGLDYDFIGAQMSEEDNLVPAAEVLRTVVANAAKYYSARPTSLAASVGDLHVKATDIYSQVVPSSLQEILEVNVDALGSTQSLLKSSSKGLVTVNMNGVNFTPGNTIYLGSPCTPDTLNIVVGGTTLTDSGGVLKSSGDSVGTVNYAAGTVSFSINAPSFSGVSTVTFHPAAPVSTATDTALIEIVNGNRGNLYTNNISPPPKPGTVTASYRSLGNWFDLVDNGSGGLIAQESSIGVGTINYQTGALSLTLGSLPDIGSAIIFSWGNIVNFFDRSNVSITKPVISLQLSSKSIANSSLQIDWNDGAARTATADANGDITGHATGTLNGRTGLLEFTPDTLVDPSTAFNLTYNGAAGKLYQATAVTANGGGDLSATLPDSNILPDSVHIVWTVDANTATPSDGQFLSTTLGSKLITAEDDGSGNIKRKTDGVVIGTINYSNGAIVWAEAANVKTNTLGYGYQFFNGSEGVGLAGESFRPITASTAPATAVVGPGGSQVAIAYEVAAPTAKTETIPSVSSMQMQLSQDLGAGGLGLGERIVDTSIRFELGGLTYVDVNNQLYHSVDPETGVGVQAGSVDRASGSCTIANWDSGSSPNTVLRSLGTTFTLTSTTGVVLRVPNAPVRLNSFTIRAVVSFDESALTGTANAAGLIVGAGIEGSIDYDTGVVKCRFGAYVPAAGNEGEYWYDATKVETNSTIFKPTPVLVDSLKYDAVSQTFIPISSEILGLNPVRLPEDGRVPIFAKGDFAIIMNTAVLNQNFTSNTQTDLGRTRIASLTIRDSNSAPIPTTAYTSDLDLGLIDWLDLTGINQPITIEHRIEDSVVLIDVQINGYLGISQPLTHDYPIEGTLVSSLIPHGDVFASVNTPFDQKTWTGVWSDTLIGDQTLAQFNDAAYPVVVDNASAVQERWLFQFTNASTVNVIGESVGQLLSGAAITGAIAPINPATGFPYFTIPPEAWGQGWSSGNVVRFNTLAAQVPLWVIQSVGQGAPTNTDDDALTWCFEFRGDRDAP